MKAMILLAGLLVGFTAQARSLHPDTYAKQAKLLTWKLEEGSQLAKTHVYGGKVVVNPVRKNVRLEVQVTPSCPRGAFCIIGATFKTVADLPIVEEKTDSCGVVTYRAFRDARPVDGVMQEVVVKDHTKSICEGVFVAPTTVDYTVAGWNRIEGVEFEEVAFFTAEALADL